MATNACHRSACTVQSCLAEANYDEKECAWAIDRLKKCCEKMGKGSLHCAFAQQPAADSSQPSGEQQQPAAEQQDPQQQDLQQQQQQKQTRQHPSQQQPLSEQQQQPRPAGLGGSLEALGVAAASGQQVAASPAASSPADQAPAEQQQQDGQLAAAG
ncbi:hypothetical protein COHA_004968 [Chlorella ohadii]|uniref:Cx9C motif-containing protein 4, mitochondrial n=1 Tax=Chlorella ohadii TaxID=2649997 RepID=A0AAD5DSS6_9CHLO|nr:hypothetical protein COHA_004968 [Chlorella ohadii]